MLTNERATEIRKVRDIVQPMARQAIDDLLAEVDRLQRLRDLHLRTIEGLRARSGLDP